MSHQGPHSPEDEMRSREFDYQACVRDLRLDRAALRAVDQRSVEEYGIPGIVLMENAAIGLAAHILPLLEKRDPGPIVIHCGPGNNGGDGYAVARHLTNAFAAEHDENWSVILAPVGEPRPESDAGINRAIAAKMALPMAGEPVAGVVHVDALFGTGLDRPVTDAAAERIAWINRQQATVVAVDVPSGLDCDRGEPLGPTIRADLTISMVALKQGFAEPAARSYTGKVVVVPIGAPIGLIRSLARRSGG